jgi:NAD(P)-dependent dehydrogenase (short-subunit alcohol dehydrogenase family)
MTNQGALQGRIALITGGGRGIGRAIALGFAREGASVAISARNQDEIDSVVEEIHSTGGTAWAMRGDLCAPGHPQQLVELTLESFGTVDILVNNAGVGSAPSPRSVADFNDDFWNLSLALNLTVPYLLCKAVLPSMLEKKRGRIINISSVAGKIGLVHASAYCASKHGLLGLTKSLALEVAKDGITVNAICPGPVRTAMSDARLMYDARRMGMPVDELEAKMTPIGRRLVPEEIVPLAVLLAGDASAAITGQAINVCGGVTMF